MARSTISATKPCPERYTSRLKQLRQKMKQRDLEGMLITHPPDQYYLCGFDADDSWLLVTRRSVMAITDSRFERAVQDHCPYLRATVRTVSMYEALVPLIRRLSRIGIQAEHLSVRQKRQLSRKTRIPKIVETHNWLLELRSVKDDSEIRRIRKTIAAQERALEKTLGDLRVGMTERSAAGLLERHMRDMAADGPSFASIVAVGPNSAKPHHRPGAARIRRNRPILIDFGAKTGGYCGDLTRVFSIGRLPRRMEKIYKIVEEAQAAAIEAVRPGARYSDIDLAARSVIEDAGFGPYFRHSIGHGLGMEVHEQPFLG